MEIEIQSIFILQLSSNEGKIKLWLLKKENGEWEGDEVELRKMTVEFYSKLYTKDCVCEFRPKLNTITGFKKLEWLYDSFRVV